MAIRGEMSNDAIVLLKNDHKQIKQLLDPILEQNKGK